MLFLIDFDDVILDYQLFKKELINLFSKNNANFYNQYYTDYKQKWKNKQPVNYQPDKHIESFSNNKKVDTEKLSNDFRNLIKRTHQFVFPEFLTFISQVSSHQKFIITYGDINYQKQKVDNSKTAHHFNDVLVSNIPKAAKIKEYFNNNQIDLNQNIYYLDDRTLWLENVKKEFPQIKTILINRYPAASTHFDNTHIDYQINRLTDISKIIQKNNYYKNKH